MLFVAVVASLCAVTLGQQGPIWSPGGCGVSKYPDAGNMPLPAQQIVGGMEARANEFPWQVSIRRPAGSHYCGGSIISDRWILTAAHCMVGELPALVVVVAGEHDRSDGVSTDFNAESIHVHAGYDSRTMRNDVALIKVSTSIAFSSDIQPVCSPDMSDQYEYSKSQCSGWGTLSSGGACCPETLQYVTLNVTTNTFCDNAYPRDDITTDMICASDNNGGDDRDSCQGDSGGPMTVQDSNNIFHIVGVVSWGIGCASGYPGVYARVSHFNDWITQTMASN